MVTTSTSCDHESKILRLLCWAVVTLHKELLKIVAQQWYWCDDNWKSDNLAILCWSAERASRKTEQTSTSFVSSAFCSLIWRFTLSLGFGDFVYLLLSLHLLIFEKISLKFNSRHLVCKGNHVESDAKLFRQYLSSLHRPLLARWTSASPPPWSGPPPAGSLCFPLPTC